MSYDHSQQDYDYSQESYNYSQENYDYSQQDLTSNSSHVIPFGDQPIPPDGFDLTEDPLILPDILVHATCTKLYVEPLRADTTGLTVSDQINTANHYIIKVDFQERVGDGYLGARLSMEVNWDIGSTGPEGQEPSRKPGKFIVKPVRYLFASNSTPRAFELGFYEGTPLGYLIHVIVYNNHLHLFNFTNIGDQYYGCRDWV